MTGELGKRAAESSLFPSVTYDYENQGADQYDSDLQMSQDLY